VAVLANWPKRDQLFRNLVSLPQLPNDNQRRRRILPAELAPSLYRIQIQKSGFKKLMKPITISSASDKRGELPKRRKRDVRRNFTKSSWNYRLQCFLLLFDPPLKRVVIESKRN
jgi:hypothetical protein